MAPKRRRASARCGAAQRPRTRCQGHRETLASDHRKSCRAERAKQSEQGNKSRSASAGKARREGGSPPALNPHLASGFLLLDIWDIIPSKIAMKFLYGEEILCNRRIKIYPNTGEIAEDLAASRPIFNPGFEVYHPDGGVTARKDKRPGGPCADMARSCRRARQAVFDLAACNNFDLFITLTLNRQKVNRYDYKAAVRRLSTWLDNRVRRAGLRYVIVPEYHKDGAVHFHGLINADAVKLVDSGHRYKDGRTVYNLPEWALGFTTALRLSGSYRGVCAYVCKYVTKEVEGGVKVGGRWYLSGGALLRPVYRYENVNYATLTGREYSVQGANLALKYLPVQNGREA